MMAWYQTLWDFSVGPFAEFAFMRRALVPRWRWPSARHPWAFF